METCSFPFEQFPSLAALPLIRHGFTTRVPGIDVAHDKAVALKRLDAVHCEIRRAVGVESMPFITAEQVHGNAIGVVDEQASTSCLPAADGLVTNNRGLCLGIYVADCCAVFLVDPVKRAIGLVHSGRKGTELGIVVQALQEMSRCFGTEPADVIAQLSPCIRPPHYEVDFAAEIARQCHGAGATNVTDAGICTACDLNRYYSYRAEKGRTGRMLALLALA